MESLKENENKEELQMRKKKECEELEAKEKQQTTKEDYYAEDVETLLDMLKEDYNYKIAWKQQEVQAQVKCSTMQYSC